jgi:N-acyl-D-aspartate/D-glutamate deacylase
MIVRSRVLGRCIRDLKLFSMQEANRRMTFLPAMRFGISGRGRIARRFSCRPRVL